MAQVSLPIEISFAHNEEWETRGTAYSLYTGFNETGVEPVLCCMGDHLVEPEALKLVLRSFEMDEGLSHIGIARIPNNEHKPNLRILQRI